MIFYPAMSCVTSWFFKRRAFAFGVVASGSSLGGKNLAFLDYIDYTYLLLIIFSRRYISDHGATSD